VIWGIWGTGAEGRAAAAYLATEADTSRVIVADENATPAWPDLPADATFVTGPGALERLLEAGAVVVSPGVPGVHPFRQRLAAAGVTVTSGTDLWLRRQHDDVIGVTGTKGKSTTTSLLAGLLNAAGRPARVAGNIGVPLLSLPAFDGVTVAELSSYQCHSITRSPRIAVITNLYQEHLNWHGDVQAYWRDKCRIFTEGADVLVCDQATLDTIRALDPPLVEAIETTGPGPAATALVDDALAVVADLPVLLTSAHGRHDLALAVCAAQAAGVALSERQIADAVRAFDPLPHRLSLVGHVHGRDWYDDTLSTSAESVIAALYALAGHQRVVLVGGMSRGISYDGLNDYLMTQHADELVWVVTVPTNGREIVAPYERAHPDHVVHATSLMQAVGLADTVGIPDGSVTLSPGAPSYDLYANHEAKSAEFIACLDALGQRP